MKDDIRYEAALQAALAVIHKLTHGADLPRHEKLATATFIILDAIHKLEQRLAAGSEGLGVCPRCLQPCEVDVWLHGRKFRCRTCGTTPTPDDARGN